MTAKKTLQIFIPLIIFGLILLTSSDFQFDNELSFSVGEVVYLLRHIDQDWLEGNNFFSVGETMYLHIYNYWPYGYIFFSVQGGGPGEASKSSFVNL